MSKLVRSDYIMSPTLGGLIPAIADANPTVPMEFHDLGDGTALVRIMDDDFVVAGELDKAAARDLLASKFPMLSKSEVER